METSPLPKVCSLIIDHWRVSGDSCSEARKLEHRLSHDQNDRLVTFKSGPPPPPSDEFASESVTVSVTAHVTVIVTVIVTSRGGRRGGHESLARSDNHGSRPLGWPGPVQQVHLTTPSSVVVNTQGRESGGSRFETCSGVWYRGRPQAETPLWCGH